LYLVSLQLDVFLTLTTIKFNNRLADCCKLLLQLLLLSSLFGICFHDDVGITCYYMQFCLVVMAMVTEQSYSALSPVSTVMGNHSQVYHLSM